MQTQPSERPSRVRVLSIAGTDPSGGAGLMGDLRTMAALGAYGMGVVTNVVAQNTQGVRAVDAVSAEMVRAQLLSVSEDVSLDGLKIGMVGSAEIIDTVWRWLADVRAGASAEGARLPVVLDPVMISTSGTRLLDSAAIDSLRHFLASGLVDVVTPNIPELAALLEEPIARDWKGVLRQAAQFSRRAGIAVYAKAGHLEGSATRSDAFVSWGSDVRGGGDSSDEESARAPRILTLPGTLIATENTHGTGCTLSSALATFCAQERCDIQTAAAAAASADGWAAAASKTKFFMNGAIAHADELRVGQGHGPVDQLWNTSYGLSSPQTRGNHQQ